MFKNSFEIKDELLEAGVKALLSKIKLVFILTFFSYALALLPTWYMLEVYGRVLNSSNMMTLGMLTSIVVIGYAVLEYFYSQKQAIILDETNRLEDLLVDEIFKRSHKLSVLSDRFNPYFIFSDFRKIKDGLNSPGFMSLLELPFVFLVLLIILAIDPFLSVVAFSSVVLVSFLMIFYLRKIFPALKEASQREAMSNNYLDEILSNSQLIAGMGMQDAVKSKWEERKIKAEEAELQASNLGLLGSILSKFFQTVTSSVLLGIGCYIMITSTGHDINGATLIVTSILGGRVLSPFVSLMTQWRVLDIAIDSYERFVKFFNSSSKDIQYMSMPAPDGSLVFDDVTVLPEGSKSPILFGINFAATPGEFIAIIGPTGSGKSTLIKTLLGLEIKRGNVRISGNEIHNWNRDELGQYIGYLPQEIDLIDGTLKENVCRFSIEPDDDRIKEVCSQVGLDSYIESLTNGYDTNVGKSGHALSGGVRQRVGLARAIYTSPKYLVLDEPNSFLDATGERDLFYLLQSLKDQGTTIICSTHKKSLLKIADKILVLVDGRIKIFGSQAEVLAKLESK